MSECPFCPFFVLLVGSVAYLWNTTIFSVFWRDARSSLKCEQLVEECAEMSFGESSLYELTLSFCSKIIERFSESVLLVAAVVVVQQTAATSV